MRLTPEQFRSRLLALSNARGTVLERATGTTMASIKREVGASAFASVRHTPKPKPSWVRYDVKKTDADQVIGTARPRGGFAYLAELGSYKHPSGYVVRRNKKRARFAETSARRSGWHPAIKAQPYWQAGVDRAAISLTRIYHDALAAEIRKQFP